ncbi:hypothetical protein POJ06DRAFT_215038, partial [Lipomyces tetrasporus]
MTLAPDPRTSRPHGGGVHYQAPSSSASSAQHQSTSATTSAPVAASAAPAAAPPVCQNCATSTTPLWRRDESGQVLCNACGLFLKLHGRARPISLKTDVIKSRNRIKNPHHAGGQHEHEISPLVPAKSAIALAQARGHSPPATLAPIVKPTSTPPLVHSSIAPANAALSGSTTHATMESLVTANQTLRTRVSELELVNDLFRSRISELESNEASARKSELTRRELETQLQRKLEESGKKNMELQSRVEELEIEKERFASEREKVKLREQQLMQ